MAEQTFALLIDHCRASEHSTGPMDRVLDILRVNWPETRATISAPIIEMALEVSLNQRSATDIRTALEATGQRNEHGIEVGITDELARPTEDEQGPGALPEEIVREANGYFVRFSTDRKPIEFIVFAGRYVGHQGRPRLMTLLQVSGSHVLKLGDAMRINTGRNTRGKEGWHTTERPAPKV